MPLATNHKPLEYNIMIKNSINKEYALQVLQENYENYRKNGDPADPTTLREYVEAQSESDPNFFRWLFNSVDIDDFTDLTDDQKEEYKDFLDSWCE